jgi:hypothetical protein
MVAVRSMMLPLGTRVPDFRLPDSDGKLRNHCPFVIHIGPTLGQRARQWMDQGLAVLAINANDIAAYPQDGPEHMPAFAEQNGWSCRPGSPPRYRPVPTPPRAACLPNLPTQRR